MELQIENQKHLEMRLDTLQKVTKKIQSSIDNVSLEGKREIIDLLIDKVFVKGDGRVELEIIMPNFRQSALQRPSLR